MKREYFGMLFLIVSVCSIFAFNYIFGEYIVQEHISKFIIIWILIAFFVGQYSMRFPKSI
ncbi:hypothetical protein [Flavobacterium frigoris]|uniref:Uncharacterized protein n=1 Tax=Flavobacterium frigoris TaxID=229204 RepID=A0A1H9LRG6_FLAFI|nr:hypothetical protein [Flavobacterium frigoris]SER14102.1 hypothetical protein SAMN05444355_107117 [Flavobacterium frigoris]